MKALKYAPGVILLGIVFYLFVFRGLHFIYTDSESMLPAIRAGDRMAVMKSRSRIPPRGSVIHFRLRFNGAERHVKRVVGLPGDIVEIRSRSLFINGGEQDEPYLYEQRIVYSFGPAEVPEDHLFVLGDNRNNSLDSTVWGFLPAGEVFGRVRAVYWPYLKIID